MGLTPLVPEALDTKSSATGPLIAFDTHRRPVWTPRDYASLANEGFMQNAIVYRSVRMIAEAVASVPFLLYAGEDEIAEHPLLRLVSRPNPFQTGPELIEAFIGHLLVSGNAYLEAVSLDGEVKELHALRPDRMKIIPGLDGWPEAWEYTVAGRSVRIATEPVPGMRPILHLKQFHATNDHYGLSPLEAAASAIDLHNTASQWNKALLDNAARPSGALVYTARDGNMTAEQYERLKSELESGFQGSANAGRPLLLEGGLDWKSMSLSPKDMDFIEARHVAAREIALALGVPPMLLGIPGDNTYSNLAEANRIFWRSTVLPLANRLANALSHWLAAAWPDAKWASEGQAKEPLRLAPDLDSLEALASEREALWARLEKTSFLSLNEKRTLAGFTPRTGGDELKFASDATTKANFNPGQLRIPAGQPDGGRWSGGDGAIILAQDTGRAIDLLAEEARGGHTIAKHVGKSEGFLLNRVRTERVRIGLFTVGLKRAGSFPSLEAANKLVNSTIDANGALVNRVARGERASEFITKDFGSKTGIEAYARNDRAAAYIRDTYGVGVFIVHDRASPGGYRVVTAYPRNEE